MKLLTKKQQRQVFDCVITLYLLGSEATEALATNPTTGRVSMMLMKRQERMIDSLLRAADTLRGRYGLAVATNIQAEYRRRRESGELPKPCQPEPSAMTILQECDAITEALRKKVSARDFRISSQDIVACAGLSGSFEMGFCEGIIVALDCLHPLDREAALREICNGIKASATDKSRGQGR
jgi:hypothetical protein